MPEILLQVSLPEMGESVTEGSIVEWRVKPGQWIDAGATLVDVTTDKVDVEVPAPAAGIVVTLAADEGATVNVGALLAEIDTSAVRPDGGAASVPTPVPGVAVPTPSSYGAPGAAAAAASGPNGVRTDGIPRADGAASHRAQRVAERAHLDLATIVGTGPDGLVVAADVVKASSAVAAAATSQGVAQPPLPADARATAIKGPANALVGAMEQSLTIPTATSFRTVHVGTLEGKRAELNAALKAAGRGEKISYTHIIAFALVRAAREIPMTVSFRRENGVATRVENGIHLGIAVDTQRKDGSRFLVVPVIKSADALDFIAFRSAYEELIAKAREGRLGADDLSGASFTLTNPGGIGTVASVPRLTVGQGAIVAAGAIAYPPGFANVDPATIASLGVEKIMTLTNTYDHRVVQGAQSGDFLKRVDTFLAGKDGFYDDVFASAGLGAPRAVASSGALATSAAPQRTAQNGAAAATAVTDLPASAPRAAPSDELLRAVAAGVAILSSYRRHGHLAATLDPLGTQPPGDPALDTQNYALTPSVMSAIPASVLRTKLSGDTLADVVTALRATYSSTIAYEVEHIANIEQREWLREYIETGKHFVALAPERARRMLERLTNVETFERFLRKAYIGAKTFSIEGLDAMVPMLEEIITLLAEDGVETTVIGMAHRGRLSTIAHVVNRPYEETLAEFESADVHGSGEGANDLTGDVKYHHGASGIYPAAAAPMHVILANNPSHLEAVDGVVEGRTRALQTDHLGHLPKLDVGRAAPVLVHGDAAFSAQGVVAEVLNLQALAGYATGGTIHLISNNQVGFTTEPRDARSTRYASDLAKGFDVPVMHVNADDVDACIAAVHLAMDFRRTFGHDAIVDLIGYRRFGHNETDEPAYTQPAMAKRIAAHPSVRELYAKKLVAQGAVSQERADQLVANATARLAEAHATVRGGRWAGHLGPVAVRAIAPRVEPPFPIDREKLIAWTDELLAVPSGFVMHPKLRKQLERRRDAFALDGECDWGLAESLALASILARGVPVRMSGQDTQRGTFSHRHLFFHDRSGAAIHAPIQHLSDACASVELVNSPLSEYGCLGFEYGYAVEMPSALVLWEAQFGDFNNGAQIIIDQFIAAGRAKWGETSRLTLLLPHGHEGAGPEHSSARIERFLQLSGNGNVNLAMPSTAAQYYHLLRVQALKKEALPLVIFTPKSLLRLKAATGSMVEIADQKFKVVIDDARFGDRRDAVERVLLCSGKIYYDLIASEKYAGLRKTAIVRVELLAPLPVDAITMILSTYPNLRSVSWVQEEPYNMGARGHIRRRICERLPSGLGGVTYIGRPWMASPSEGYGGAHATEQARIIAKALDES